MRNEAHELPDMVAIHPKNLVQINSVVHRNQHEDELSHLGIQPARCVLLVGSYGTGKREAAKLLCKQLGLTWWDVFDSITKPNVEAAEVFESIHEVSAGKLCFFEDFSIPKHFGYNQHHPVLGVIRSLIGCAHENNTTMIVVSVTWNEVKEFGEGFPYLFDEVIAFNNHATKTWANVAKHRYPSVKFNIQWDRLKAKPIPYSMLVNILSAAVHNAVQRSNSFSAENITVAPQDLDTVIQRFLPKHMIE